MCGRVGAWVCVPGVQEPNQHDGEALLAGEQGRLRGGWHSGHNSRPVYWTLTVWVAMSLVAWAPRLDATPPTVETLYQRASGWPQFVASVRVHPELWHRDAEHTAIPPALVERLARAGRDLRLLVVAEDWCTDSANTLPYVARLASLAGVELRIVNRTVGAPLMTRHPSVDGRGVTPLVVFVRGRDEAGAWVERPRPLQEAFRTMADDPASHHHAANRQAWYDADKGRTALEEIVTIAERTVTPR